MWNDIYAHGKEYMFNTLVNTFIYSTEHYQEVFLGIFTRTK